MSVELEGNALKVATQTLPVGYRRWVTNDFVPRKTSDLLVVCVEVPNQSTRFLGYSLDSDWRSGMLGPNRSIDLRFECVWDNFSTEFVGVSKP